MEKILKYKLFDLTPETAADAIFSAMKDFLFITNPSGKIQRVNQAVLTILGYNESELISKSVTRIFTDEFDNVRSTIFQRFMMLR